MLHYTYAAKPTEYGGICFIHFADCIMYRYTFIRKGVYIVRYALCAYVHLKHTTYYAC